MAPAERTVIRMKSRPAWRRVHDRNHAPECCSEALSHRYRSSPSRWVPANRDERAAKKREGLPAGGRGAARDAATPPQRLSLRRALAYPSVPPPRFTPRTLPFTHPRPRSRPLPPRTHFIRPPSPPPRMSPSPPHQSSTRYAQAVLLVRGADLTPVHRPHGERLIRPPHPRDTPRIRCPARGV
jgi:hypothetical protein